MISNVTGKDILLLRSCSKNGNIDLVISDTIPVSNYKTTDADMDIDEILLSIFDENGEE